MVYKIRQRGKKPTITKLLFLLFFAFGSLLTATLDSRAQTPQASPSPGNDTVTYRGYDIKSSFEIGVRGVDVNGNINKYRSDFNYRSGLRIFDSSFSMENKDLKRGLFDSLSITSSGWNADPSGFTRITVEKIGVYRFDSTIRQVVYFNNLNNHTRNARTADTRRNFGDFDLTIFPKSDLLRFRLGASFNRSTGIGGFNTRAYSDEFPITSNVDNSANDFRAGVDSKVLGFNLSFTYGFRKYADNAYYSIVGPAPGYNTTNTTVLATFERFYPTRGKSHFGLFSAQRTIAKKLDFTARIIYSITDTNFSFLETITGRNNTNQIVDLDRFDISGDSTRPQTRGDLGLTYAVTKNFRISNTFSFDTFNISGGSAYANALFRRSATGGPVTPNPQLINQLYHRVTGYRRFVNTFEGDYQFGNRFGLHLGYRYAQRRIDLSGFNYSVTVSSPPSTSNPSITAFVEEDENTTQAFIAGFKAKPMKNWTIFADLEIGEADNAFTRLANYNYTNLRVRSRWSFNRFAVNLSALTKDNENPSTSTAPAGNYPAGDFIANTKTRIFSAYVDWSPIQRFSLSTGYTYQHLTSETDIVINTGTLVRGLSRFLMRDNYFFVDVSAKPIKRISFFASYRYNKDRGQGDQVAALPTLLTSYPFKLYTMESRIAFRVTKNIDWNIGYQYLEYNERFQPLSVGGPQDYHANLPYTSLRIFFGGGDR